MNIQHKYQPYEPKKCWNGDKQKICYADEEEAEMAARLIEAEHRLPKNLLYPYHCEYGDHWHLARKK